MFVIEGWNLVVEAIESGNRLCSLVYEDDRELDDVRRKQLQRAIGGSDEVYSAMPSQLKALSETQANQGVWALVRSVCADDDAFWESLLEKSAIRLLLLDGVSDPGNCGSIIRSCDWFGLDGVVLGEGSVDPESPKVVRSTMGSIFRVPILRNANLSQCIDRLGTNAIKVIATTLDNADSLYRVEWPDRFAIAIGNESLGVRDSVMRLADTRVKIPRFGKAESLNAAVASGVVLSEWRRTIC